MLYFKQVLRNKWTYKSVNWILTEIEGENIPKSLLLSRDVYKKCEYGSKRYLFVYRLVFLKIIEILDCILLENQQPFIEPYKNIHFYYPFLGFIYTDIGIFRKKFFWERAVNIVDFEEIESLAGDPTTMVETWKRVRGDYLSYKGEIENRYASSGFKEYPVPPRLKLIFEQVDQILDFQRSKYSPVKLIGIVFTKGKLTYKDKSVRFKVGGVRAKIIRSLYKNPQGLRSRVVRDSLSMSSALYKTNIRQIKERIKAIDLTIRYDLNKKVYLLSALS